MNNELTKPNLDGEENNSLERELVNALKELETSLVLQKIKYRVMQSILRRIAENQASEQSLSSDSATWESSLESAIRKLPIIVPTDSVMNEPLLRQQIDLIIESKDSGLRGVKI